jgi:RimJ/RimL family protein N-acetyltransferase
VSSASPFTFTIISTSRLELVRATLELAECEHRNLARFADMLGVSEPDLWPPPLNDEQSQQYSINRLRKEGESDFQVWYMLLREGRQVIGLSGFKSKPEQGVVEIGYSVVPRFQRHGYCTEAVRTLIGRAFTHATVERVAAETLPHLWPSIRVMEKCRMRFVGHGAEEEGVRTVRYEVSRTQFFKPEPIR